MASTARLLKALQDLPERLSMAFDHLTHVLPQSSGQEQRATSPPPAPVAPAGRRAAPPPSSGAAASPASPGQHLLAGLEGLADVSPLAGKIVQAVAAFKSIMGAMEHFGALFGGAKAPEGPEGPIPLAQGPPPPEPVPLMEEGQWKGQGAGEAPIPLAGASKSPLGNREPTSPLPENDVLSDVLREQHAAEQEKLREQGLDVPLTQPASEPPPQPLLPYFGKNKKAAPPAPELPDVGEEAGEVLRDLQRKETRKARAAPKALPVTTEDPVLSDVLASQAREENDRKRDVRSEALESLSSRAPPVTPEDQALSDVLGAKSRTETGRERRRLDSALEGLGGAAPPGSEDNLVAALADARESARAARRAPPAVPGFAEAGEGLSRAHLKDPGAHGTPGNYNLAKELGAPEGMGPLTQADIGRRAENLGAMERALEKVPRPPPDTFPFASEDEGAGKPPDKGPPPAPPSAPVASPVGPPPSAPPAAARELPLEAQNSIRRNMHRLKINPFQASDVAEMPLERQVDLARQLGLRGKMTRKQLSGALETFANVGGDWSGKRLPVGSPSLPASQAHPPQTNEPIGLGGGTAAADRKVEMEERLIEALEKNTAELTKREKEGESAIPGTPGEPGHKAGGGVGQAGAAAGAGASPKPTGQAEGNRDSVGEVMQTIKMIEMVLV